MKISHHPAAESLMSCSAGSMPDAFAAVMSCHIEQCPACRKELGFMEAIGAALLDRLDATAVTRPAPVMALRGLEADVLDQKPALPSGDVPAPLVSVIGSSLEEVPWKRVSAGVWQHVIKLPSTSRGELRLVKVGPGQALPEHAHTSSELTLILRGSYRDSTGHYKVGDVADLCGDVAHSPLADPVEGCICLIATDGKLKFKSVVARLVQPFTGF